ncbi:translocation/assembly module TamB domain-containing protein [Salegentibacter chungangensis]|uniref:Translocation/assembly module TamB domain-containing protein n=1 Tax=Salegentibacter chungangensis TaxID=1335724 RepID=A0ABW3NU81_9FLAO
MKQYKKRLFKILKVLARTLAGIIILLLLLILFIRSPWGQNIIKDKFVSSLREKTNTKIELEKLFVTFSGNIELNGLYLEDEKGDTLVYSKYMEANIPLWPIIKGNAIAVEELKWEGLKANIIRNDSVSGFNYSFLTEALSSDSTTTRENPGSSSTKIRIGDISLKNIDVTYKDKPGAIDSQFIIGELKLELKETDLEKMRFSADDAHISNTSIKFTQTGPFPESDPEEQLPMPILSINSLQVDQVKVNYKSEPDSLKALTEINDFSSEVSLIDLQEQVINLGSFTLKNSEIQLRNNKRTSVVADKAEANSDQFQWPEWKVNIKEIDLHQNRISYFENNKRPVKGSFDPGAIVLKDLNFKAKGLYLMNKAVGGRINSISFQEASGITSENIEFNIETTDEFFRLTDLKAVVNQNRLAGDLELGYQGIQNITESPGDTRIDINISDLAFDIADIFRFQPALKNNEYVRALSEHKVFGNFKAKGKLSDIGFEKLNMNWGNSTSLAASGNIKNVTKPEKLYFSVPRFELHTRRKELLSFIEEKKLGISIPAELKFSGNISGSPSNIETVSSLNTSEGNAKITGSFSSEDGLTFNTDLNLKEANLGKLLNNEKLGKLNLELKASGNGETINKLDASFESRITSFSYNNYSIKDWIISGEIEDGKGVVNSKYKDSSLNAVLDAYVQLDSVSPAVDLKIDLKGANLMEMGISKRDIRIGAEVNASFKGNSTAYEVSSNIIDGIAVYDKQSYLLGDLDLTAFVRPDTTSLKVNNRLIYLDLESNASPVDFSKALNRHFRSYLTEVKTDTIGVPVNLKLRANINPSPILSEVFLLNLEDFDTLNLKVDFKEKERQLDAQVELPHLTYYGGEIDSLKFNLNSGKDNLKFNLGFNSVDLGPLALHETKIKGEVVDEQMNLDFLAGYQGDNLISARWQITRDEGLVRFHLRPDSLRLNKNEWTVNENNEIRLTDNKLEFHNFRLSRNDQVLEITNDKPGVTEDHIALNLQNFGLASLFSYLNPERKLATGRVNGEMVVQKPFTETGILADLRVDQFSLFSVDLGILNLKGETKGAGMYDFQLETVGGLAELDLVGNYQADSTAAKLDLVLDLKKVEMEALEGFSAGAIKNTSGSFSGLIKVGGTTLEPKYNGELHFKQAKFNVAMLNAAFILPDEHLKLDNAGIYFDKFRIEDENNNYFTVDGDIFTETYLNPKFDLSFKAEDFKALNSTKEDNDLFYGTATFDLDAKLTGDLDLPNLNMKLDVGPNTNLTYVIPEAELAMQQREGIVMFVNRENPDAILTKTEEEVETFTGYNIEALLSLEDEAIFRIVIDEETGDNFQVQGEGDLNFNLYPNGRTSLTGRYEMSGGHYEMSLYNLVKRKFEIAKGSTVTWSGDPFDASLDVRAIYKVETSASSLMAAQTSGADASVADRFRRELPFLVYLNVEGELMEPEISFGLDMPEDEQGSAGGQVYGRIRQLNNQEQELNKQVFSLLVLNRFYPSPGSDGSQGGTAAIARNNINQALSDQLNMFSDKLLGDTGVQLNFGVDSYTDYQGESPQQRTQLDITARKKLLNDRLIVSVGSEVDVQGTDRNTGEASPIIGNVSIEYLLTENGRFRLKGFRRNEFENVIDGQVIVSGIALIFTREFNEFRELWKSMVEEERKKQEEKMNAERQKKREQE